jgi:hypothetical protein
MLRAQADLVDAEERENLDAQRSALEKLAKIRIDQDIARRKAMKDARDVLTTEQRDRLPKLMSGPGRPGMRGGRGMMRPGSGPMADERGASRRMGPPVGMQERTMRQGMPRMRPPGRDTTLSGTGGGR